MAEIAYPGCLNLEERKEVERMAKVAAEARKVLKICKSHTARIRKTAREREQGTRLTTFREQIDSIFADRDVW